MDANGRKHGKRVWVDDSDDASSLARASKRPRTAANPVRLQYDSYTIAWICALPIEMAAANAMLDRAHSSLPPNAKDSNSYILGNIGQQNIVVACLPADHYGTNAAAVVATNLIRTFPSIRTGLMVGIGGGVPGSVDIRLGDIIVGYKVVQHDLGKVVSCSRVHRTGIPKCPPSDLLIAVSKLQMIHESTLSKIPSFIQEMLEKHPKMTKYSHPGSSQDRLFLAPYSHKPQIISCDSCDTSMLVKRIPRENTSPVIYYGNIASGNQVMRDAISRDQIARELDVICFEMEAAGLVDTLPCLVIRGICDYSDSHKNKQWQRYAAATAAAFAKELLIDALPQVVMESSDDLYHAEPEQTLAAWLATGTQWTISQMLRSLRTLLQLPLLTQMSFSSVIVIDSRGCYLPIHLETVDSKELFIEILKHRFKDLGTGKIERGEWILENQHYGQQLDLSEDWQSVIKPNQTLKMSMIFRRQNEGSTKCPSCGLMNPGSSDLVECRRCSLNYRRIEEIQDIQIGESSTNVQKDTAEVTFKNVSAQFPRPRPPKSQSLEDDIGRYKHVQLVDVNFKIGPTRFGQQIMESALKLSSGDLTDAEYLAEKLAHIYGLSVSDSLVLSQKIGAGSSATTSPQTTNPRTAALRGLSWPAQRRERKRRSRANHIATNEGRVSYLLPSDQLVYLDYHRCVTCGLKHQTIQQLQVHLEAFHPAYNYILETTSQGPQFRVNSRCEPMSSPLKQYQIKPPDRTFNIETYLVGDQS